MVGAAANRWAWPNKPAGASHQKKKEREIFFKKNKGARMLGRSLLPRPYRLFNETRKEDGIKD
jgi:hypothetical protein